MRDFTPDAFKVLMQAGLSAGYAFRTVAEFAAETDHGRVILVRHDVDKHPQRSLHIAQLEADLGIRGTFYFRIVPESFDSSVIRAIAALGHEVGYHYEDLTLARGDVKEALRMFAANLARIRELVPVSTICMHGSPATRWDNRDIWQHARYADYGIIAEPYFDIDFSRTLYLTDTGRQWDGGAVSVRDKVVGMAGPGLRGTSDVAAALAARTLADQIMITVHPQRWVRGLLPWTYELMMQTAKNQVKRVIARRRATARSPRAE